jgi:SAM-dependent methyltransferase
MMAAPPDFLSRNLVDLPFFRALLRAVEAKIFQSIPLQKPILDLGCGDGHFASVALKESVNVGLDPWKGPARLAAKSGAYRLVIQGNGCEMPFRNGVFNSIVSNSVLEHIPDVEKVLAEANRVLKRGSFLFFCVPNHNFLPSLSIARFLDKIHCRALAALYRRFFNRISRHYHSDSSEVWRDRLAAHGFAIEKCWHYFSPRALAVMEWGHYLGLPNLIIHFFFRRWNLFPYQWNFALIRWILQPYYDEAPEQPDGVYSFFIARKA